MISCVQVPYVADGMVFTSYASHTQRSSRTSYSIRREAGMRVDAIMGEADGEDEKMLLIQSLRAMVDGFKMQVAADQDLLESTKQQAEALAQENAQLKISFSDRNQYLHVPHMPDHDLDLLEITKQQAAALAQENAELKKSLSDLSQSLHVAHTTCEGRAEISNDPLDRRPIIQDESYRGAASPAKIQSDPSFRRSPSPQPSKPLPSPGREPKEKNAENDALKEASMMLAAEVNRLNEDLKSVRMLEQGAATQAAAAQKQLESLRFQLSSLQVRALRVRTV